MLKLAVSCRRSNECGFYHTIKFISHCKLGVRLC